MVGCRRFRNYEVALDDITVEASIDLIFANGYDYNESCCYAKPSMGIASSELAICC